MNATAPSGGLAPGEPMIRLDGVGKRYPDGTVAVHELDLDVMPGEVVVPGRSVGLRQVHDAEDDQPADRADQRSDLPRGSRRDRRGPGQATSPDRLRHPADRALPAPEDRHQRGHRALAHRHAEGRGPPARARAAGPGRARPRRVRRPLPAPALRWSAAARRRGPCPRGRPARAADGRAVRGRRPRRTRAAAGRVPAAPGRARQDRRPGHPRHRRGREDGRQGRGARRGRPARPVRDARRSCSAIPPTTSSPTSWARRPGCAG